MKDNSELFWAIVANLPLISSTIVIPIFVLAIPVLVFYPFTTFFDALFLVIALVSYPVVWAFLSLIVACLEKRFLSKFVGHIPEGKDIAQELSFVLRMNIVFTHWILMLISFSPFLSASKAWVYRLAGVKMGRNVRIHGTFTDLDLIEIGDNCIFGYKSVISGHAFDVSKRTYARIKIGNNCLIGAHAIVFPGATIEDGVRVGANVTVPKFAHLKAGITLVNQSRIIKK